MDKEGHVGLFTSRKCIDRIRFGSIDVKPARSFHSDTGHADEAYRSDWRIRRRPCERQPVRIDPTPVMGLFRRPAPAGEISLGCAPDLNERCLAKVVRRFFTWPRNIRF
jgi:hypothetical protein